MCHVLKYNRSEWLRPFIDFRTDLCKNAKKKFARDITKLHDNDLYGKMLENKRSHASKELVHSKKLFLKLSANIFVIGWI